MSPELKYQLTEEVARQAVEVALKTGAEWHVSFSNPTAGPWKMIQLPPEYGSRIFRYGKEEDRPDLILVSPSNKVGLVLEAKDSLTKLLSGGQLEKSIQVFRKEMDRFIGVVPHDFLWVCGYVYPISDADERLHGLLMARHDALAARTGDRRVVPSVHLAVRTDGDGDLHVGAECHDFEDDEQRLLLLTALDSTAVTIS